MLLDCLVEDVSPASLLASVCWQVLAGGAFLQTLPLSFFSSCSFCFIYFALNYLFSFWLRWVFVVFSSCCEQGAALSVLRAGFFLTTGCRRMVLSSWAYGLIAPRQVKVGDRTRVPCVGRRFPALWTAREIPVVIKLILALFFVCYHSVAAPPVFTWPCF